MHSCYILTSSMQFGMDSLIMQAAVARGDLAAASMIYSNGANSVSGRTLRNFKVWGQTHDYQR